jgi:hypothetical protein
MWQAINAPNDPGHLLDYGKADAWLQRVLDLTNPQSTPGFSSPNLARDIITRGGLSKQLQAIQAAWQGLGYYYQSLNIPPWREAAYKGEFERAYGKNIQWDDTGSTTDSAFGPAASGWITQQAANEILSSVSGPLATHLQQVLQAQGIRYIIRAFVTPDGKFAKLFCPQGTACFDLDNTRITTTGWGPNSLQCGDDWRCTYWQTGYQIILPSLVLSMNLAYSIASQLKGISPDIVVKNTTEARGTPLAVWANPRAITIPDPPARGGAFDLLSPTVSAIPRGSAPPATTPAVTPIGTAMPSTSSPAVNPRDVTAPNMSTAPSTPVATPLGPVVSTPRPTCPTGQHVERGGPGEPTWVCIVDATGDVAPTLDTAPGATTPGTSTGPGGTMGSTGTPVTPSTSPVSPNPLVPTPAVTPVSTPSPGSTMTPIVPTAPTVPQNPLTTTPSVPLVTPSVPPITPSTVPPVPTVPTVSSVTPGTTSIPGITPPLAVQQASVLPTDTGPLVVFVIISGLVGAYYWRKKKT